MTAPEPSRAPLDVAFLRSLSEASELSLLTFLSANALKQKKAVFHALAELLEQDGFVPGGLLAGKSAVKLHQEFGTVDTSLSLCLLQAFAPQSQSGDDTKTPGKRWRDDEREEAMALVTRFAGLHTPGSAERQQLLDALLFQSCKFVHDAPFAKKLIELGANPDSRMASSVEKKFSNAYLIQEAAEHGNAALAGVVFPRVRVNLKDSVVGGFVQEYSNYSALENQQSPGSALAYTLAQCPGEISDFLSVFDQELGSDKTAPLRARILSYYLLAMREQGQQWSSTCIDAVMGPPGGAATLAMQKAATQDADNVEAETVDGAFKPLRELYCQALKSHCPSVVALFSQRLRKENDFNFKKPEDPLHWVCTATAGSPGVFDENRFRATLEVLVAHGHRLERVDTKHPPAVHLVAKSGDEETIRLQKLKVLLEMGVDPFCKSQTGVTAKHHVPPAGKDAWEGLARSFLAREVASDMLKELVNEMNGAQGVRASAP